MTLLVQPHYTAEEYLRLERAADHKSEFLDGRIYAIAGGSREHDYVAGSLYAELRALLRGRSCDVFSGNMRVKVSPAGLYTYPDVSALCGEAQFDDGHVDTLLNPSVIIEVLSESTERYDRGKKFGLYRKLQTLREYILVAQDVPHIEQYVRQGELWTFGEINGLESALAIPTLDCTIPLASIYERVRFPAPEDREVK